MKNTEKYPRPIRILHWLMALMIIGLFAVGLIMDEVPRSNPLRDQLFFLHKSFGVTVLVLALARIVIRFKSAIPALPEAIPALERKLAHLGHKGLYFFMLAIPLSGIVMSNSYGFAVSWFGLELPRIVGVDKERGHQVGEMHELLAWVLMGLVALHVAGAVKHHIREHINLFKRMM